MPELDNNTHSLVVGYGLWVFGFMGAHRFYYGRPITGVIWFHAIQPEPPSPTEDSTSVERDAELALVGRSVTGHDQPVVVAGDLNDVAWSHSTTLFRRESRLLGPRVGRGLYATFHATTPVLCWPLDHVFHSDHFGIARLERLDPIGSDHFPVLAELALQPAHRGHNEAPERAPRDDEAERETLGHTDTRVREVHSPDTPNRDDAS